MTRRRWILLSLALFFLLAGGGGWWWIYHLMHVDITPAELGVEEDFFDFSSAIMIPELESGHPVSQNQIDQQSTHGGITGSTTVNGSDHSGTSGVQGGANNTNNIGDATVTAKNSGTVQNQQQWDQLTPDQKLEIIRDKYVHSYTQLQNLALDRLDTLVSLAKQEYNLKKNSADFSKIDFASKYSSAANKLQDEVNRVFYQVLEQMKKELKENKLPLNLAKEAEDTYKSLIKKKKDELLSKMF
jgi:hypothetical protein